MATTIHGFPIPATVQANRAPTEPFRRGRRIPRRSRRALRILAHAIEYVANEFLHETAPPSPRNARLQAVQLLMEVDRQVYSECPEVHNLAERCRWFLRMRP